MLNTLLLVMYNNQINFLKKETSKNLEIENSTNVFDDSRNFLNFRSAIFELRSNGKTTDDVRTDLTKEKQRFSSIKFYKNFKKIGFHPAAEKDALLETDSIFSALVAWAIFTWMNMT